MKSSSVHKDLPGPGSRDLVERSQKACLGGAYPENRNVLPMAFANGCGSYVEDADGNSFIDFCFSLVAPLGHGHPRIAKAAKTAFSSLANASSYPSPARVKLSELIILLSGGNYGAVQFFSTGAEAVEAGLWFLREKTGRDEFLAFFGSNHGKTHDAISLGAMKRWHGLRSPGFVRAPYAYCYRCFYGLDFPDCGFRCVNALDRFIKEQTSGRLAGIVVEPIQGNAIVVPPPGYLHALRTFCDERDLLLAVDEVMTGLWRCGSMLAINEDDIVADIVIVGKGLGNGLPITGVLVHERLLESVRRVTGNTTFGGNPLCCTVACECLAVLAEDKLAAGVVRLGQIIREKLGALDGLPYVGQIRGKGMLFGVEFVDDQQTRQPSPELCLKAAETILKNGVVTFPGGNVLELTPALNIPEEVLTQGLDIVVNSIISLQN